MSYIAIPDPIIFSKSLNNSSKLLYGLIKRYVDLGKCFATNAHFSEVLNCNQRTIERSLKELISHGYIESKVVRKGERITKRILTISGSVEVPTEMSEPGGGTDKNVGEVPTKMSEVITEVNNREYNPPIPPYEKKPKKQKVDFDAIKESWNEIAVDNGLSRSLVLTDKIKNNIRKLIVVARQSGRGDYSSMEKWPKYFKTLVSESEYIDPRHKKLEWATRPETYRQLLENVYQSMGKRN